MIIVSSDNRSGSRPKTPVTLQAPLLRLGQTSAWLRSRKISEKKRETLLELGQITGAELGTQTNQVTGVLWNSDYEHEKKEHMKKSSVE